ncbi:Protein MAIN-LIKE 2 [Linum grandiflorum]
MRLPIAGHDLSSISNSKPYIAVLAGLLELTVAEVKSRFFRSGAFSIVRLLEHMEAGNIPYDTHEASVYLYCLLGSMLFCNTTNSHAPVGIISGLDNVREVDTYAWGAATLAHMYRALGKGVRRYCSRESMSTFRACVVVRLHYPELTVIHLQGDGMVFGSLHARL